ncbi:MAG TPA: hypothetical protein VMA09_13170 [Candidatus Binataceae bacterium]|nr:hypothetical protein [Candidatus Binataceae bacterium]
MSLIQIGLMDKTRELDPEMVQNVAAALNIQVTRDLPQFWNAQATVIHLGANKVPSGVWPVYLVKSLPPGEGGFHLDKHNQPYAEVIATPDSEGWTVAASHEIVEMLVDPYGNRLQSSTSIEISGGKIEDGNGQYSYLVEACDPCEADQYAYTIQGIAVSDFLTPHFYDLKETAGSRYSFTGALKAPRQILPGGYISWVDQSTEEWQQLQFVDPNQPPKIVNLGPAKGKSLREWVHTCISDPKLQDTEYTSKHSPNKKLYAGAREHRMALDKIAKERMKAYEAESRKRGK